jgi:hypothetical protein
MEGVGRGRYPLALAYIHAYRRRNAVCNSIVNRYYYSYNKSGKPLEINWKFIRTLYEKYGYVWLYGLSFELHMNFM